MKQNLVIAVQSDLYEAGKTEDGESYVAEIYKVVAESPDGARWVHFQMYPGCRSGWCDEADMDFFEDIRPAALQRAESFAGKVRVRLANGGMLNLDHWQDMDPAYGSEAYQREGSWWAVREKWNDLNPNDQLGVYA